MVNQLSIFYGFVTKCSQFRQNGQARSQSTNKNVDEGAIRDWFRKFVYPLLHPPDDYLEDVWSTNSVYFMVFSQNAGQQTLE